MEEILNELTSLVRMVKAKDDELNKKAEELNAVSIAQRTLADQLVAGEDALDLREKTVKEIEDVDAMAKDTAEKLKKLGAEQGELIIQRNALEAAQTRVAGEFQATKMKLDEREGALNSKEEALNALQVEIEETKKNYKNQVLGEIKANMAKL